jgi:hypothetical protein
MDFLNGAAGVTFIYFYFENVIERKRRQFFMSIDNSPFRANIDFLVIKVASLVARIDFLEVMLFHVWTR